MTGSSGLRSSNRKRKMIKVTVPSEEPGGVDYEYLVATSPIGSEEDLDKSYEMCEETSNNETGKSDHEANGPNQKNTQVNIKPHIDDKALIDSEPKHCQTLRPQRDTSTLRGTPLESDNPSSLSWLLNFKVSTLFENIRPDVKEGFEEGRQSSKDMTAKSASGPSDPETPASLEGYCCASHRSHRKPPFTYTELIEQALREKHQLTVSGIYQWISTHFPYYNQNDDRWKNSVRHNLSINPHFRKGVKASQGAGHLWNLSDMEAVEEDRDKNNWKKNRLKSYLESLQPNDYNEEYSTPNSVDPPPPTYVEIVPQGIENTSSPEIKVNANLVHYMQSNSDNVLYIPDDGDHKLYTIEKQEDHKLYSYDTGRNLIMSSYDGGGQEKVEIYSSDPLSRKSILEYAAHDIIMEEQQNGLIYSMYDEQEHYDTLPLFPDEFTLSCYNNIPPLL